MKTPYSERAINRYYCFLTAYTAMAKQIENCANEDEEFYQDVCFLLSTKIKAMQAELTDQGFVLCQGSSKPYPCEKEKK